MEALEFSNHHRTARTDDSGPFFIDTIEDTLKGFEIASFDVFDTLVYRNTAKPSDLFEIIGRKIKDPNFLKNRIQAEVIAREISNVRYSSNEVSIDMIYEVLFSDEEARDRYKKIEIDEEIRSLNTHPFGFEIYKKAKSLGLKIIAISDMYLSSEDIENILNGKGIFVDKIYSSSDELKNNLGKYNGKMYSKVAMDLGCCPSSIIHFGDNFQSDFMNANAAGVAAVHLPSAIEDLAMDTRFNQNVLTKLQSLNSLESSLVIGNLSRRVREGYFGTSYNVTRGFGYLQGGATAAAFLSYLSNVSELEGKKKLLLLTRDGFSIKIASQAYGLSMPSLELLWSSRRMCLIPLLAKGEYWVLTTLFPFREGKFSLTAELERLHLNKPEGVPDFQTENYNEFIDFLKSIGKTWKSIILHEVNSYRDYINHTIGELNYEQVAIVDVGWGLTSHRAIDNIVGFNVSGYYLGTHHDAYDNGKIKGLFFQKGIPSEVSIIMMSAVELLELIFSDTSASAIKIVRDEIGFTPQFEIRDVADMSRDLFVREVRAGMLDFLRDLAPYSSLLHPEELRRVAETVMLGVMQTPTTQERSFIGNIPHVREVGKAKFHPISHWWKVSNSHVNMDKTPSNKIVKNHQSMIDASHPRRMMHNKVARRLLTPIIGENRVNKLSDLIYGRA